jgi:hypothetical protein
MIVRATFPQVYELEHPKKGKYWPVSARSAKWGMHERRFFPKKNWQSVTPRKLISNWLSSEHKWMEMSVLQRFSLAQNCTVIQIAVLMAVAEFERAIINGTCEFGVGGSEDKGSQVWTTRYP